MKVILPGRLHFALEQFNPQMLPTAIEEAVKMIALHNDALSSILFCPFSTQLCLAQESRREAVRLKTNASSAARLSRMK